MSEAQFETDQAVRKACEGSDFHLATTRALEAYGPEVLSFVRARLRSESDGDEVFSLFAEDVWKGLPGFSFRCSVRAWMYTLARNAANRYATAPQNRRARNLSLSDQGPLSDLMARVRTATESHRRTEVKDKVRELRDKLPLEDQTLLTLHIDRGLTFGELAMVMHVDGEQLAGDKLARETLRLRKRFERLKIELRALAIREGMLKG